MNKATWVLLAALVVSPGAQAAVFYTGNQLLGWCQAYVGEAKVRDVALGNICSGFIAGTVASHDELVVLNEMSRQFCFTKVITNEQVAGVVLKYMEAHPDDLRMGAGSLVLVALAEGFPCD